MNYNGTTWHALLLVLNLILVVIYIATGLLLIGVRVFDLVSRFRGIFGQDSKKGSAERKSKRAIVKKE
jgi:hypothetical protein